jgi:hypothetical protein
MSYIGNTVDSVINGALNYGTQYSQQFSGNGSQTVFTLSAAPGSVNSIVVDINGVAQYPGTDFTWSSGTSLTFTTAPVTGTNNILVRWAQTLPTGTPADGSVTSTKFTQAVIGGEYALVTSVSGTNTITGTIAGIASYAVGQTFRFVAVGANTGAVAINLNGIGAVAITKNGAVALVAGDIPSGATVIITHDGTRFQLMNVAVTATVAGGSIYENANTLTSNYTLSSGKNAVTVGPYVINSGVTLTIPTGQRMVIL